MATGLRISLLGPIQIELDGRPLDNLSAVKARALLAYLATTGHPHTRQHLAGLLWSDVLESSARNSLRVTLMQLRKAVGNGVDATRQTIGLQANPSVWVDVRLFEEACRQLRIEADPQTRPQELRAAVHLYQGEFLAGFHIPDAALFEEWVVQQREHYRRLALEAFHSLAKDDSKRGAYAEAIQEARRLLELEPIHEEIHRLLMVLLAQQGQRSAALAQFETCRQVLEQELGVAPDPATVALAKQIRSGAFSAQVDTTPIPALRNQGGDGRVPSSDNQMVPPPFTVPPLPPQGVCGREDSLDEVLDLLAFADVQDHGTAVALQGMAGVGKTTLAQALGRHKSIPAAFPDGVLWVSVGPSPLIRGLLDNWGRALGISLTAERDEEACSDRLRSILYTKRALLIVDDIWDIQHGLRFNLAGPLCRTIFTTRESPIAHALATRERTRRVDVLQPGAALDLLSRLAPEAVETDGASAQQLCKRLEYLPLALTLAGRMLANEADVPFRMQHLVRELLDRRKARLQLLQSEGRLGLQDDEPVSLQAMLGMSIERLSSLNRERFARLAVFGAEPLVWDVEAVAHVWGCSVEDAGATVSSFIKRGLVTRHGADYWTHSLLADYAAEMLEALG